MWRWLFQLPREPRSVWGVIAWWEWRRLPYNLIIGSAGLVSLSVMYACADATRELEVGEDLVEPFAVLLAPVAANVCYTAGWVVELLVRPAQPRYPLAPRLLRLGLIFSLVVIALPAVVWLGVWLADLINP